MTDLIKFIPPKYLAISMFRRLVELSVTMMICWTNWGDVVSMTELMALKLTELASFRTVIITLTMLALLQAQENCCVVRTFHHFDLHLGLFEFFIQTKLYCLRVRRPWHWVVLQFWLKPRDIWLIGYQVEVDFALMQDLIWQIIVHV